MELAGNGAPAEAGTVEVLKLWRLFIFRPSHNHLHSLLPVDVISLPQFLCLYIAEGLALTAGEKGKPIYLLEPKTALNSRRAWRHGHLFQTDDSKVFANSPVEFLLQFPFALQVSYWWETLPLCHLLHGSRCCTFFSWHATGQQGAHPRAAEWGWGMLPFLNYTVINQHCPWLRMAVPHRNINSPEAFARLALTSSDNTGDQGLQPPMGWEGTSGSVHRCWMV